MAQVHRSPGFINSSLIGKSDNGSLIKEFEASHGTVSDMWHEHLDGKETSLNPLGLVEALISAMQHSVELAPNTPDGEKILTFTHAFRNIMHAAMVDGKGKAFFFLVGGWFAF
jgi:isocitrate dehydrogenase